MKHLLLFFVLLPMWILQAQPFSGSFTVGGSSPNFATLQDAADAAISQGVSGPVFFNIRPGTYTRDGGATTVLNISTAIPGVSPTSRVTFQPDAASGGNVDNVILHADFNSGSLRRDLVQVQTDYITFRNLTLRDADSLDTPAASFLSIDGRGYTGIVIDGCRFIGTPYIGPGQEQFGTAGALNLINQFGTITITNNKFYRILNGITYANTGSGHFIVEDNEFHQTFMNVSGSGGQLGVAINLICFQASIKRNFIDGTGGNGGFQGIRLAWSSRSTVERNLIRGRVVWGGGGALDEFTAISTQHLDTNADSVIIANNLVYSNGASSNFGINTTGTNTKVLHNTIQCGGGHATALTVIGANCTVLNNIISGSNGVWPVFDQGSPLGRTSNYNIIVPVRVQHNGNAYTTLAAYQGATGLDINSASKAIDVIADSSGLHLDACQAQDPDLNGIPLPDVPIDYYGAVRDTVKPFRGAVEGLRLPFDMFGAPFKTGLPGSPFSLDAGKFDNPTSDGIALPDYDNRQVHLFHNNGASRTFSPAGTLSTGFRPSAVKFFDLDHDGHLDLIVGGDTNAVKIFWGDGGGSFPQDTALTTDGRVRSLDAGRVSFPGRNTIVLTEDNGFLPNTSFLCYLDNSSGRHLHHYDVHRPIGPGGGDVTDTIDAVLLDVAVGDLDGNGSQEVAALSLGNFPLEFYVFVDTSYGGGMPWGRHTKYRFGTGSGTGASSIIMGDLDGDGDKDFITVGVTTDSTIFIRNEGNLNFSSEIIPTTNAVGMVGLDYENDGDLDFVTINYPLDEAGITVFLNDGSGHFTAKLNCFFPYASGFANGIVAADFDHDGKTDIAIAGAESLFVLYNLGGFNGTTGVEHQPLNELPEEFVFSQNYPNPFNPSTTINYELTAPSHVTLTIYDLLGREVATVLNEDRGVGRYSTTWNGSSRGGNAVASGVYFYRVEVQPANGQSAFTSVKKMVLLK